MPCESSQGKKYKTMIYLHKLLPLIVSPLGIVIALLLLALVIRKQWPLYAAISALLVCALPLTAHLLWVSLEAEYPYQPVGSVPKADAVVVLSGMLGGFESDYGYVIDWGDPDRLFVGVQLLKFEKSDFLIFTRGQLPWENTTPEGEILKEKAVELGVSSNRILLTSIVSNTAEEALAVKQIMDEHGLEDVILVSSSFHLPRAKLLFDHAGISTFSYPTDHRASGRSLNWLSIIPSASAFASTSSGLREYIGRLYYWLKLT